MNLISTIFLPHQAFAIDWNISNKCTGNYIVDGVSFTDVATIKGLECLFQNIAQVIIYFAGLVFFIMFIKGGFKYMTSGGDPKKTASASHILAMSIMGIVGVILSFIILKFISTFTGINVTDFKIPG